MAARRPRVVVHKTFFYLYRKQTHHELLCQPQGSKQVLLYLAIIFTRLRSYKLKEEPLANVEASLETRNEFIAEPKDFIDEKESNKESCEQPFSADYTS